MVENDTDFTSPSGRYFKMFIEDEIIKFSFYEKLCKFSYKFLKVKCPNFLRKKLHEPIFLSDMKITPDHVFSLSITSFILSFFIFFWLSFIDFPSTLVLLIFPFFIVYNVFTYPQFHSEVIRIRAGNEIISIILYIVTYLSLNPVFEKAIEFAASRCHGPLGNDLKKVIWDIESGKYDNIEKALAIYTRKWTLWNEEFVNSLALLRLIEIQATLDDRNEILRTAVERTMRNATNKMEEYAFNLKMPSMMVLLFGITMPLIGLIMFPMISIFLTHAVNPLYIGLGYTVFLPFFLWWFLYRLISKRPATYSHSEKIEEVQPRKYIEIKKLNLKIPIVLIAFFIGFLITIPGIIYYIELASDHYLIFSRYSGQKAINEWGNYCLSKYEPAVMVRDTFKAMTLIWGIGAFVFLLTYLKTKGPYEFDLYIRKLEEDFTEGLFELQTALKQNIPLEIAILKVSEQYKRLKREKTPVAKFFAEFYQMLLKTGRPTQTVLFGKNGLITNLPSSMIKNIMRIITSALYKGSVIASRVTKNIVTYLRRLREIEHIIKKSMAEIISNLTMAGGFISPVIAGIVASSSVVMVQLLQAVARVLKTIEDMYSLGTDVGGSMSDTLGLINLQSVMPPTLMQLIGGIYLIEIVIIISIFVTGIDRGFNKVYRDHMISNLIIKSMIWFTLVFFIMVLLFQPIVNLINP